MALDKELDKEVVMVWPDGLTLTLGCSVCERSTPHRRDNSGGGWWCRHCETFWPDDAPCLAEGLMAVMLVVTALAFVGTLAYVAVRSMP